MPNEPTERRQRAVRLTEEAFRTLNARLLEAWRQSGRPGRLTKAGRSELMDVSTKTADRILSRSGNDRLVLVEVFTRLGLKWSDEFCEPCRPNPEPLPERVVSRPEPPAATFVSPPRRRRFGVRHAVWLVIPLTLGTAPFVRSLEPMEARLQTTAPRVPLMQRAERLIAEGRQAYNEGKYDSAISIAREAHEIAKRTHLADAMAEALRLEGESLVALGKVDEAIELYERAHSLWEAMELTHGRASLLEVWGQAELRRGRAAAAEQLLTESLAGLRAVGDMGGVAGVARTLGSIAAERKDLAAARRWYETASQAIADRPDEPMHTDLRSRRALLKRDEGRYEEALADLEVSLLEWKTRKHDRWIATTLMQMATVHRAAGNPAKAARLAEESQKLFAQVGDEIGVRRCDEMLTQLKLP
ncbi:MAG: tetratricopeptide repeat protein [Fimbriimonadaceae bacterium]